ncbi:MAG TPA: CinA family nicotinamide mononucleotide deamidase-related protein [Candidatus Bathyarchaeia archaeon]|nr:CinA family nicotinamide mononucleotide deamidase-related protein [Candidatus Bathyarchaeia archaeon]
MKCELLMIGTELLLGQIVDTNAAWMAQTLAENGIDVYQKTTVGDNPERIKTSLAVALDRADVLLTSGGLGPTEDDITRECIADLLGRPLEFREDLFQMLVARFNKLGARMSDNNKRQAFAPRGAVAIENPNGTAPGLIVEDARGVIVSMPGVPHELKPMMTSAVLPYLRTKFGLTGVIHSRVLKICGIGESRVDAAIGDLILNSPNPTIGLLASPDAVRIRITAKAASIDEADALIDSVEVKVRERLPGLIMGAGEKLTIEGVVDGLLREKGWTLAVGGTAHAASLAQRLAVLDSPAFRGAKLSRDEAESPDVVRKALNADCALLISGSKTQTQIHFLSPEGAATWEVSILGADAWSQTRLAILALEYVRRHLTAVQTI